MTRYYRERSRLDGAISGSIVWSVPSGSGSIPNGTSVQPTLSNPKWEKSRDYIGRPVTDSPFIIDGWDRTGISPSNGVNPGAGSNHFGWEAASVNNVIVGRLATDYAWHVYPSGSKTDLEISTEVLARTNPSRPQVNPGMWLQNLWELPFTLKGIGDNLKNGNPPKKLGGAKNAANVYLGFLFGWAPLFEDITVLLNVMSYVDRRNAELHALFEKKGGAHHRVQFGTFSASETSNNEILDSGGAFGVVNAKRVGETKMRVWATVRWFPTTAPGWHPNDAEYLALAKKVVTGATASGAFAAAWDVIPWTWLLGWVINVRSFVMANGNTIPAASSPVSIMRSYETTHTFSNVTYSRSWIHGGEGTIKVWTKQRFIFSGTTFGAFLPHLDAGRLSVLGALTVQRLR